MSLNISWSGSPPFEYCYGFRHGPYNISANETCGDSDDDASWITTNRSWFMIRRFFFTDETSLTVLLQVRNQVSNHTKIITINTIVNHKQSQLSVIVVPVIFILFSIVAIIFGVAHYVQSRNRYDPLKCLYISIEILITHSLLDVCLGTRSRWLISILVKHHQSI